MSMEINNYSSYATNYTERIKKSDSKAATEVKTGTSANSKDGVQEYYEKLVRIGIVTPVFGNLLP